MTVQTLTDSDKKILLQLARRSIVLAVDHQPVPQLNLQDYSAALREDGAAFVTLTQRGRLRGCIGALEAYQPLVQDVCEHAAAAATEDYRFPPVRPGEVGQLHIEISRLTPAVPLEYQQPDELLERLRPGVDGVILRDGGRRATFLPQVWEQLPDTATFLTHLCQKMGAESELWRKKVLQVATYQVEEFHEETPQG
jgi:uncharacterized protein